MSSEFVVRSLSRALNEYHISGSDGDVELDVARESNKIVYLGKVNEVVFNGNYVKTQGESLVTHDVAFTTSPISGYNLLSVSRIKHTCIRSAITYISNWRVRVEGKRGILVIKESPGGGYIRYSLFCGGVMRSDNADYIRQKLKDNFPYYSPIDVFRDHAKFAIAMDAVEATGRKVFG